MTKDKNTTVPLECEEWFFLSLQEIISSFGVSEETVIAIIDEGIVSAKKDKDGVWQFDKEAISSIRKVLQLNRDLGVNVAGAGLAIELLKEIEHLRTLLNAVALRQIRNLP